MPVEDWLPKKAIFTDVAVVAAQLVEHRASLVIIDGGPQAGKSMLARELASHLNWRSYDLDTNLPGDNQPYVRQVDMVALSTALRSRPLLLSGICIRQILESTVDGRPDISIYVVRETSQGLPGDLHLLDAESGGYVEELPCSSLDRQVQIYHRDYKPIQSADWLFIWTER